MLECSGIHIEEEYEENEYENEADKDEYECKFEHDSEREKIDADKDDENGRLNLNDLESDFKLPEVPQNLLKKGGNVCKNCPFTYVKNKSGKRLLVRKSSLVWMLNGGAPRIRSDRLVRAKTSRK